MTVICYTIINVIFVRVFYGDLCMESQCIMAAEQSHNFIKGGVKKEILVPKSLDEGLLLRKIIYQKLLHEFDIYNFNKRINEPDWVEGKKRQNIFRKIKNCIWYNQYKDGLFYFDLNLDNPIYTSDKIAFICVPKKGDEDELMDFQVCAKYGGVFISDMTIVIEKILIELQKGDNDVK